MMNIRGFAAVLLACATSAVHAQEIRKVNPAGVAKPVASYSHVAEVPPGTRLLFLAGQVGNRPDGSVPPAIEDQAVQALENIRLILAAEGSGPDQIVKLTFYAAARPKSFEKISAKRAEMFKNTPPPPSTWVYVSALANPDYLIEIEATAAVPVKTKD